MERCVIIKPTVAFTHLGSGEVAVELPLFTRVSQLCPLASRVVSVGQTHIDVNHRSLLCTQE